MNKSMQRMYYVFMACLLFVSSSVLSAELSITVKYPDKTPAKGIKIQEVELERQRFYNRLLGATDDNGTINIEFEQKPRKDCKGETPRGYGIYRYVVMPTNYRWEISDIYYWNKEPYNEEVCRETNVFSYQSYQDRIAEYAKRQKKSNWLIGELVRLRKSDHIKWEVVLNKGRDVTVSVVDESGGPIKNTKITIRLDLGFLSHTGGLGGTALFDVQTNDQGNFILPNAGDFYYSFELHSRKRWKYCVPDVNYWSTVLQEKFEENKGNLIYHKCVGKKITIIVTDKQTGKPIPKASISKVMLFPSARQGGPFGYTDNNGRYSTENFYTEHVVELGAGGAGYKFYMLPIDQFIPGKIYKISLERIYSHKDLAKLTYKDVVEKEEMLYNLYSRRSYREIQTDNLFLALELYNLAAKYALYSENIPKSVVVVRSMNPPTKEIRIPWHSWEPAEKLSAFISKIPEPILYIGDTTGGNCYNCSFVHILLLSSRFFLQEVGTASRVKDQDKDGTDDLITYEDIWENGLGYLCHADAPAAIIFWKIQDGKLVKDILGHKKYYRNEIERLDREIKEFPKDIPPKYENTRLLTRILSQFLIYRLLGNPDDGWRKFRQNIKHYDSEYFYLNRHSLRLKKIAIVEIENRMKESLKKK